MASGGGKVDVKEKVKELMEDIESLQRKRDEEAREDAGLAFRIQVDIFKKYTMVYAMLCIEGPGMPITHRAVYAEWRQKLDVIAKEFEQMEIPRFGGAQRQRGPGQGHREAPVEVENQDEPPVLEEFPNEVWEVILSEITSASDKLNVIEALPFVADLMNWGQLNLQFELVFPILMKQKKKLKVEDVINLCGVNDSFRDSIFTWFESELKKEEPGYHQVSLTQVFQMLQDRNIQLDTIPFKLLFSVNSLTNEITRRQFEALNIIGTSIGDCEIILNETVPTVENMRFLRDYLVQMPNLQSLKVEFPWTAIFNLEFSTEEVQQIQDVPLPDLLKLKYLKLLFDVDCNFGPIMEALMRKYHSGLVGVIAPVAKLLPKFLVWSPREMVQLKRVEIWKHGLHLSSCFQSFRILAGAPLKIFRLRRSLIDQEVFDTESFPCLMKFLSQFVETLEDVHVRMGEKGRYSRYSIDTDPLWVADLNFPNVKSFWLGNNPGSWNILLQMPAMEKLTIDASCWLKESRKCGPKMILDLSEGKDSARNSNIWKMLPFLDVIEFRNLKSSIFKVSRKECIKYQRGNE